MTGSSVSADVDHVKVMKVSPESASTLERVPGGEGKSATPTSISSEKSEGPKSLVA